MKMSISWHEESLSNLKNYLTRLKKQLDDMNAHIDNVAKSISFAEHQISEARKRGLNEYDEQRFCVKRGKKPSA